jgi:AcrR family transcriptional regulator
MTVTEGLRERKKAETRAALQSAALRLADQLGPEKVTVEAVAEAAGVSPRTFFNYFPSKEAAILDTNRPSNDGTLLTRLKDRPASESPLDALRAAFLGAVERLEQDPDSWVIRQRLVQRHPDLAARWAAHMASFERDIVVEVARRTKLDPDRDTYPAVVVGAAMAAIRVAMTVWQNQPEDRPTPLATLFTQTFEQLASGLAKPRTRRHT